MIQKALQIEEMGNRHTNYAHVHEYLLESVQDYSAG